MPLLGGRNVFLGEKIQIPCRVLHSFLLSEFKFGESNCSIFQSTLVSFLKHRDGCSSTLDSRAPEAGKGETFYPH